ncbi:MAG TPA: prolyl oligopeptidase family serine peptidase [Ktedonobacteraceae bacterium]|jgi:dipeptidyl aminopeptidase/acylaminoacyl peptidase
MTTTPSLQQSREIHQAPYGSWESPITAAHIAADFTFFSELQLDGRDIYWLEQRSAEAGRTLVMRRTPDGHVREVTPPTASVGSRVHEYGGGAYAVRDGVVYFSHLEDGGIYCQRPGEPAQLLTGSADMRYADLTLDPGGERLFCVREDHTRAEQEAENTLVSIDLRTGSQRVLVSGNAFYAAPRPSPDGLHLAWLTWNHPAMPWDQCALQLADLRPDGSLGASRQVAGGAEEAVCLPEWSPRGELYFVSDASGWWNLYRASEEGPQPLAPMEAEFGVPHWSFGLATYAFLSADQIICTYTMRGTWYLGVLDLASGKLTPCQVPYTYLSYLRSARGQTFFCGGSSTRAPEIVAFEQASGHSSVLHSHQEIDIDPAYLSLPEAVEFPSWQGERAHAFYYPPCNPDYAPLAGELPPLLVKSHPGPTLAANPLLDLTIQYWTSRGIGVLDVNYGGSTGYGRAYRQRLAGQLGVVDVEDCSNGALHLVHTGQADRRRIAISGRSAGGYTTLCALVFKEVFQAGACYYGINNLEVLAMNIHKFESHYLQGLVGPYPQCQDLYRARSPINFVARLCCPVIFLQGSADPIATPEQAEEMVQALRSKGLPVAYLLFEGEGHGFERAENIVRALDSELFFYARIFGFVLPEGGATLTIENLSYLEGDKDRVGSREDSRR